MSNILSFKVNILSNSFNLLLIPQFLSPNFLWNASFFSSISRLEKFRLLCPLLQPNPVSQYASLFVSSNFFVSRNFCLWCELRQVLVRTGVRNFAPSLDSLGRLWDTEEEEELLFVVWPQPSPTSDIKAFLTLKYCVSLLIFVYIHIHWCIPDFHLKWLSCFMKDHLLYALQQYSTSRKFLIQYRPTFRKLDIKQKMKNGRSVHCNGFTCSKIVTVIFQTEKNYFLFNIVLFMFN